MMLCDDVLDVLPELGTEERRQLGGVVQAVAPAERRLLGKFGERDEPLGPACVAKATTRRGDGQAIDDAVGRAMDGARKLPISPGQHAGHVLAVAPEELIRPHARQQDLDPGRVRCLPTSGAC